MPLVKYTCEGLKPVVKKEPITSSILRDMIDVHVQLKLSSEITVEDLLSLRTVVMCLLAYTGFLRFNELAAIRLIHITFNKQGLNLFIPSSKTDIYHGGRNVVISKTHTKYCPVEMLEKYISLAQIKIPDLFLFRSLSKVKGGYRLREANQPMSYTRVREVVLDAIRPVVDDVSRYGVHSLRAGDATVAAQSGVPDRLFKRHGRWRSENAKDGYVKDSMSDLLSVSQSLGL